MEGWTAVRWITGFLDSPVGRVVLAGGDVVGGVGAAGRSRRCCRRPVTRTSGSRWSVIPRRARIWICTPARWTCWPGGRCGWAPSGCPPSSAWWCCAPRPACRSDVPGPPEAGFEAEAAFWAALTGWPRRTDLPEFDYLQPPAGMPLRLLLQRTGGTAAGMHLDFACDDVPAEVARHVELGAVVMRRMPDGWTTLRDPVRREYCVTARPT